VQSYFQAPQQPSPWLIQQRTVGQYQGIKLQFPGAEQGLAEVRVEEWFSTSEDHDLSAQLGKLVENRKQEILGNCCSKGGAGSFNTMATGEIAVIRAINEKGLQIWNR